MTSRRRSADGERWSRPSPSEACCPGPCCGAGLVVEIDSSQHTAGLALVVDHLRQNDVTLQRGRVLRISLLGLRVSGEAFLDQVARGLSGPGFG